MVNLIHLAISVILLVIILIVFSREKLDYVAYSLVCSLLICIITPMLLSVDDIALHLPWLDPDYGEVSWLRIFINMIEFEPIMFIIGMQLIVLIAEKYNIFQWIAVKSIHLTKGNHRVFFYVICIISTITAAIIADVTVAIIFIPLVISACRSLKIRSAPYLYGVTITINVGSVLTPFSSSKNVLISSEFGLNIFWFGKNLGPFILISLFLTLTLLDIFVLSKHKPRDENRRELFLEIMNPDLVIINRKKFKWNSIFFIFVIIGFVVLSGYSYLISFIGGILICLLNRETFTEMLRKIDLKVVFFFISVFLLVGSMELNGVFSYIGTYVGSTELDNTYIVAVITLLVSSIMSGFLASNPTAVFLVTIMQGIFPFEIPNIVAIALVLGVNFGGNVLPQGATCDLVTLNIAKEKKVRNFSYRSLFKLGGKIAILHITLSLIYISIYSLF